MQSFKNEILSGERALFGVKDVAFTDAIKTLWSCADISGKNVSARLRACKACVISKI